MKAFKWLGIVVAVYVVFVVLFETVLLGYNQPSFEDEGGCSGFGQGCGIPMIVITTTDDKGQSSDRMLARFNSTDGKIYVSAHHWPRSWYKEAIKNPNVKGKIDGEVKDYVAVPVEGDEFEMVARGFPLRLPVKIMMGFPPKRQILRLDSRVTHEVSGPRLYIFDCGSIRFEDVSNFGFSNDQTDVRELFVPCYLIEHDKGRLLWDSGLPLSLVGQGKITVRSGMEQFYERSLLEQLKEIDVRPEMVNFIALSHMHFDHVGAAKEFKQAKLLIQQPEFEAAFTNVADFPIFDFSVYKELKNNKRQILNGDFDVFGDGSVMIVNAPGHTPGHQVLLLRLKNYGPLLLSGDLYHFVKSRELKAIPSFNIDAEQTLRSMEKIEKIITSEKATLWIEHNLALAKTLNLAPAFYD